MKELLRRIKKKEEELGYLPSLSELDEDLRKELEKRVAPEILDQGMTTTKAFLNAF